MTRLLQVRTLLCLAALSTCLAVRSQGDGDPASQELEPMFGAQLAARQQLARLVGERLRFTVRWGPIPAGEAVLAVEAGEGRRVRLVATAKTLPAIDALYRVRDSMVSTVRPDLSAFTYEKHSEEGKRQRHERIKFDLGVGRAHYRRDEQPETSIEVPQNVRDPLSCLYAFRLLNLDESQLIRFPVSDGRKVIEAEVAILRRESLETPAGRFETMVVQPRIEGIGGVFKKSPGSAITIWLTDDEYKRPVRMESEVAVGKFVAELVELEHSPPAAAEKEDERPPIHSQ